MNIYLLNRDELGVIADALREYKERHCGKECLHLTNCATHDSCGKLSGDLNSFRNKMDRIEFIEDDLAIFEVFRTFAPDRAEPRWLSDFSRV